MRIDVHAHALPDDYLQALQEAGRYQIAQGAEGQLTVTERGATVLSATPQLLDPARRLADMDAAEIDMQVLSLPAPNVYFVEGQAAVELAMRANDALAELVEARPKRFQALASVPLTADVDSAIREATRALDELGMVGVLIGANVNGKPIDDPSFNPFYEELNRRGATLVIHPMLAPGAEALAQYALAPLVGEIFDMTLALSRLIFSNFFGRFLSVNVVAAQLGGAIPYLTGRLDAGYRAYAECQEITRPPSEFIEHLYLDTVALYEPALRCAIETVGEDRLLFGSDYPSPLSDLPAAVHDVEHALPRRHRGRVLGDTTAKLFGIGG